VIGIEETHMLSASQSREKAKHLLELAINARERHDEDTADQLLFWASEVLVQATRQEHSQPNASQAHSLQRELSSSPPQPRA
jgi:hypothetical protein